METLRETSRSEYETKIPWNYPDVDDFLESGKRQVIRYPLT
jgi:hypothetical protein